MTYVIDYWKPVVGFEGYYEVSAAGMIRRSNTQKILKPLPTTKGYLKVNLSKNGKQATKEIHTLVATAFHGVRPSGAVIDHIDGWKWNSRSSNLEYVSMRVNVHRYWSTPHGVQKKTSREVVDQIRSRYPTESFVEIARSLKMEPTFVRKIVLRISCVTWE